MGFSNPQARKGYAGASTATVSNRDQGGGSAKAGLGQHIGMGQFAYQAIFHGAAGHTASNIAGPYYPTFGRLGLVHQARDLMQKPIEKNGVKLYYPISFTNQLGANVGRGPRMGGQFGSTSDGVNFFMRTKNANHVATWNRYYPAKWIRDIDPPPLPPNPVPIAPGKPLPNRM